MISRLFMISTLIFFDATSAQTAGQEYLVNPGVNSATGDSSTPDTGVDGQGNMPANLGGWSGGAGGAYAATSDGSGDCHSEDRMFKLFKVGGAFGHYVYQVVENLPAGNFAWSFWTKWGALVSWAAEGDLTPTSVKPTFTISTDDDADGTWEVVKTIITTQPTAANTWVEQTGIYNNQITRDVRIRFHKYGGTNVAPSNLNQLMFIDDVSLKYAYAHEQVSGGLMADGVSASDCRGLEVAFQANCGCGVEYTSSVSLASDVSASDCSGLTKAYKENCGCSQ